jgi:hypothetical protein
VFERLRKHCTSKRPHRCHACGWRGWRTETARRYSNGQAEPAEAPDLSDIDSALPSRAAGKGSRV